SDPTFLLSAPSAPDHHTLSLHDALPISAPPEWFLAIAPLPLLGLLLFVLDARYGTPLVPVLSIIAAIGLRRLGQPDDPSPRLSRSEEHTSELQSRFDLVCRLLLEKKKKT